MKTLRKTMLLLACAALFTACQESLEERVAREVREMTENKCPMPVGPDMMLDSITFDTPTLTQSQYFRFIGDSDNDSIINARLNDTQRLRHLLVSELKSTPSYKPLLERGFNFHYIYRSNTNPDKVYFETLLTKEDYQ